MNAENVTQKMENEGQFVVSLLEKFGLFWNVQKVPMFTEDGIKSNYFSIRREDTGVEFHAAKKSYEVFQNWEMVEMIQRVAEKSNLDLANGGLFNEGRKTFLSIDTGSIKGIGENNDTIKKYITVINHHDGGGSLAIGHSNVTISCSNTFYKAYRDLQTKIRHTVTMRERVDAMLQEFDVVREAETTLYEKFKRMAEVPAKEVDVVSMIRAITGVDVKMSPAEAEDKFSKAQVKKAQTLFGRINEEMAQKGETLWGLFSGVTSYTNRDVNATSRRKDLWENKTVGTAGKIDNKALNLITV